MATPASHRIAVCIATRERTDGLARLLQGLAAQEFRRIATPVIEVNVADNDPLGSAQPIYDQVRSSFPHRLNYQLEPQAGISFARNRSIAMSTDNNDYFAFIDDDEVPATNWLEELVLAVEASDADVAYGPCVPLFPPGTPQWVQQGRFFEWPRYESGQELTSAATHNALLTGDLVRRFSPLFDERFALTGGEDTHLFMRLHRAGHKIVWTDHAVVREWIAPSRVNLNWILMRGFRMFCSHSICESELHPKSKVIVHRSLTGVARIAMGIAYLPIAMFLPRQEKAKALLQVYRGAGLISGLFGKQYSEYKTVHKV